MGTDNWEAEVEDPLGDCTDQACKHGAAPASSLKRDYWKESAGWPVTWLVTGVTPVHVRHQLLVPLSKAWIVSKDRAVGVAATMMVQTVQTADMEHDTVQQLLPWAKTSLSLESFYFNHWTCQRYSAWYWTQPPPLQFPCRATAMLSWNVTNDIVWGFDNF